MLNVVLRQPGKSIVFLRSTIWTMERDRAQTFATREVAQIAIDRAKKFMAKPSLLKFVTFEEA